MCLRRIKRYFKNLDEKEKIQNKEMKKAIKRTKHINEAYIQGGKALGHIFKKKDKIKNEGKKIIHFFLYPVFFIYVFK